MPELNRILDRWVRRLRLYRAQAWAARGLGAGLAIGLILSTAGLLRGQIIRPEFVQLLLLGGLTGAILAGGFGFAWPQPRLAAARRFDRRFELRERVSTALELAQDADDPADPRSNPLVIALRRRQLEDALAAAQKVVLPRGFALRLQKGDLLTIGLLLLAATTLWVWGSPRFQAARQQRQVRQAIAVAAERIESIRDQISQAEGLTTAERRELAAPLEEAAGQLQEARSPEAAVSVLTRAEGQLQTLADGEAALRSTGEELSRLVGSSLQAAGRAMVEGDFAAAARELEGLDPGGRSQAERERLAEELEAAAEMLNATQPELAADLSAAAEGLRSGDENAARQALRQAAEDLRAAGLQTAQAELARRAAEALRQDRATVAQAGRQPGEGGSQASDDSGAGQGQAGASDAGSGTQAGEGGQDAGGAGRGEGEGQAADGGEADSGPVGSENGPGDGGLQPVEPIYAPQRLGGEGSEQVALPGEGQPGEETAGSGPVSPGEAGSSQVPYVEVFPAYAEAYRQAIESGEVPAHLRGVVRDYFSSLEP